MAHGTRLSMVVGSAVAVTVLLLSGCTAGGSGDGGTGSRTELYDSIEGLARDSTAIIVGTVTDQRADGEATVSLVEVENAPDSPALGSTAPGAEPVGVGDRVAVRQDAASRPLLTTGESYVLWLTPTMLDGDAAAQFFITGSNAGMYLFEGDTARRVVTDSGDDLPETIAVDGAF